MADHAWQASPSPHSIHQQCPHCGLWRTRISEKTTCPPPEDYWTTLAVDSAVADSAPNPPAVGRD